MGAAAPTTDHGPRTTDKEPRTNRYKTRELGSGTDTEWPTTMTPEVVPNQNVADVIVVLAVSVDPVKVNVADWSRKELFGPFPAIEPSALL